MTTNQSTPVKFFMYDEMGITEIVASRNHAVFKLPAGEAMLVDTGNGFEYTWKDKITTIPYDIAADLRVFILIQESLGERNLHTGVLYKGEEITTFGVAKEGEEE